jgi:hypothetical protein
MVPQHRSHNTTTHPDVFVGVGALVEESKISPNTVRTRCPTLVFSLGDNKEVLVDRSSVLEGVLGIKVQSVVVTH